MNNCRLGRSLLLAGVAVFAMNTAQAQTCTGAGRVLKSAWENVYKIAHPIGREALTLIPVVGQNAQAVQAISDVSEDFHDYVFNRNRQAWSTIGERALPVLKDTTTQYGTLQRVGPAAGVRVFTTAPQFFDRVEITIDKLDGRLKTEVVVCTFDAETGAKNHVTSHMFPNGRGGGSKKFVIPNVHGKAVTIKLKGKEMSFDKFKYRIRSKGILNLNKQRNRAQANGAQASNAQPVSASGNAVLRPKVR